MGSKKVRAPAPRDYKQEMLDTLSAQEAIQPRLLELERQYTPLWAESQRMKAQAYSNSMMDFIGENIPRSAQLTQQYALGMQPAFSAIGASARGAYEQSLSPETRGILAMLGKQAQDDLSRGTALSAEETRLSQQATRAAMAARGLQGGNQALAAEVLNNYNLGQARQNRARQFAGSVYGMGEQSALNAYNMYGSPLLQQTAALSPMGMYGLSRTGNIFRPESQYNAALITANRKEQMDAQIANAQSRASLTGGILKAVGTIGGAAIGAGLFSGASSGLFGASAATNFGGAAGSAVGIGSLEAGGASGIMSNMYSNTV
jgi:hypothetical protein